MILSADKPPRVDVYVSESWLVANHKNSVETGGWGAVVISPELFPEGPEHFSGKIDETVTHPTQALVFGAAQILGDLFAKIDSSQKPNIVLHLKSYPLARKLYNKDVITTQSLESYGERLKELTDLVDRLGVCVVSTGRTSKKTPSEIAIKDKKYMKEAHALARKMAWQDRLDLQGFIVTLTGSKITGERAQIFIDTMAEIGADTERGSSR